MVEPDMAASHAGQAEVLYPFLLAGMRGLKFSRWRPGAALEELVAPIVLQVLVAVAEECDLGEMNRALARPAGPPGLSEGNGTQPEMR